ncbi:MAG: hypothetical protein K6C14_07545 [Eubacterium sp.]|nr:hypothetical protein [Eubacterium sp.]
MNRKFILKVIALPLVAAVLSGMFLFLLTDRNTKNLFPVKDGTVIAYYDNLKPSGEFVPVGEATKNCTIGVISGEKDIPLLYDADYSNILYSASLRPEGCFPGETGCAYIKLQSGNITAFGTSKPVVIATSDSETSYTYTGEKLCKSEEEALSLLPKEKSSLVVYYRVSRGIGITTDYYALIYKEVE